MGAQVISLSGGQMTAARGRNTGWREAGQPEYILFLDGDTILDAGFLGHAKAALDANRDVAAVFGQRREMDPGQSIYTRVLDLDWMIPEGETTFFGGDVLIRHDALAAAGGFEDALIAGEEPELCRRLRALGWRILRIDVPMTQHDLAIYRFSQYWRRLMRAGYAFAQVSSRFQSTGDPFWSAEARRNRQRGIFWGGGLVLALLASLVLVMRPGIPVTRWMADSRWLVAALPLAAYVTFLALMAGRSAWRFRWKSSSLPTLVLYGLHSHLQQVPVALGQLAWWRDRRAARSRGLWEYKDVG
jgi:cellulose synthase/poly-beta-1,6-N-acetylglucosamine synthase-like glycosyltransferase